MSIFSHLFGKRSSGKSEAVTCAPTLDGMVTQLGDRDGVTRERARRALVTHGSRAVPTLVQALKHKRSRVRFEAAMCLRDVGDRRAIEGLVEALGDRKFEVRWVAAEGLINVGRPSVPAVLRAVMQHADSIWFKEGCHHVLAHFAGADLHSAYHQEHHPAWVDFDLKDVLTPVLQALDQPGSRSQAPLVAAKATDMFPAEMPSKRDRHIVLH